MASTNSWSTDRTFTNTAVSLMGRPITPRRIIMDKIMNQRPPPYGAYGPVYRTMLSLLNPKLLDTVLSDNPHSSEIIRNINSALDDPLVFRCVGVVECRMCSRYKFKARTTNGYMQPHEWALSINEFPIGLVGIHRQLTNCEKSQSICSKCFLDYIINSMDHGYFFSNLDNNKEHGWIPCPVLECDEFIDTHPDDGMLGRHFRQLGCGNAEVDVLLSRYQRASTLRKDLLKIQRDPDCPIVFTEEALYKAAALHVHLQSQKIMKSFWATRFDSRFVRTLDGEEENTAPFDPGDIAVYSLPGENGDLKVPIFEKFFNRRPAVNGRLCTSCHRVFREIAHGGISRWQRILSPSEGFRGFLGPWMWQVQEFPNYLAIAGCTHELNRCKICLAKHIEAEVQRHGDDARTLEHITCGEANCQRILGDYEIRLYADDFTLPRFDALVRRCELRSNKNYRKCHNCNYGHIYDTSTIIWSPWNNWVIQCVQCKHNMCFLHKVPWHEGLNCIQFAEMICGSNDYPCGEP